MQCTSCSAPPRGQTSVPILLPRRFFSRILLWLDSLCSVSFIESILFCECEILFPTCMASIKVAKDVSRVGYHEVSLWNLKVSLDVIFFFYFMLSSVVLHVYLFYFSDFGHLQLRNRATKCEDAKNARVLLFLIWDVHVVHRPTNLDFGSSAKITKQGGMPILFHTSEIMR